MTTRARLALACVVCPMTAATLVAGCSLAPRLAVRPTATTTTAGAEQPTTSTTAPSPWAATSDEATSYDDYLHKLSDPQRSDLPPALASDAAGRGAALVRADLSGEGRAIFGDYWGVAASSADAGPCCRDVVIEGAGAAAVPGRPDLVQVAVAWSAQRGVDVLAHRTTVVYFARTAGGLEPRHLDQLGP